MNSVNKEVKKFLYDLLIDLLKLMETWCRYKNDLQKNIQKYVRLKTETTYINQKTYLSMNLFNLNENYIEKTSKTIDNYIKDTIIVIIERIKSIGDIIKHIDHLNDKFLKFVHLYDIYLYYHISEYKGKGISIDIILEFLLEWKDCVESDVKIQNEMFKLMQCLKNHHNRNIHACMSFFQCSPYGDIFEKKDIFITMRRAVREFITQ